MPVLLGSLICLSKNRPLDYKCQIVIEHDHTDQEEDS